MILPVCKHKRSFADLCVFPLRIYHKDINAFDSKMMPVLLEVLELRDKKHFILLGTFAHHSADIKKYLSNFDSITVIDKLPAIHRDRPVLTYFSVNGMTLLEYLHSNKTGSTEFIKTQKAVNDIEKIATQILKYVNI